jgi:hypothetical protein
MMMRRVCSLVRQRVGRRGFASHGDPIEFMDARVARVDRPPTYKTAEDLHWLGWFLELL